MAITYKVFRDGNPIVTGLTDTDYIDIPGGSAIYTYTVSSINEDGESTQSNSYTANVFLTPPFNLQGSSVGEDAEGIVTLTWESEEDADLYNIYRDTVLIGTSITRTTQDTPGASGSFSYTVSAQNEVGESAQSTAAIIEVESGLSFTPSTFDPSDTHSDITLSNGNLTATSGDTTLFSYSFGLGGQRTGKYYFEISVDSFGSNIDWLAGVTRNAAGVWLTSTLGRAVYRAFGQIFNNTGSPTSVPSLAVSDILSIAYDLDAGKIWFAKNGVYTTGGADPSTGIGADVSGTAYQPTAGNRTRPVVYTDDEPGSCVFTVNFGASAFVHSVPSGFNPGWPDTDEV